MIFFSVLQYFPQPVRPFGSGLALIYINYAQLHTAAERRFNDNIEHDPMQRNTLYWGCFCAILISSIVLAVIMPETEGLSLPQLEDVVVRGPWIPKKGAESPSEGGITGGETEAESE